MKIWNWILISGLTFAVGCSETSISQTSSQRVNTKADSEYLVKAEPEGALPVGEARESVENEQEITLVGTIGGSSEPFVDGLAAFTIVDPKVPYCSKDEGCPTPWDYCCTQDQVKNNIATVKIVDETGKPVANDARNLLGVKELSTIVVQGKAKRDAQGNLTINASKVFVRPTE